jgi:hypothetical protein
LFLFAKRPAGGVSNMFHHRWFNRSGVAIGFTLAIVAEGF